MVSISELYWQRYEKRWNIQGELAKALHNSFVEDRVLVSRCLVIHPDTILSISELAAQRRQMNCQCNGCQKK